MVLLTPEVLAVQLTSRASEVVIVCMLMSCLLVSHGCYNVSDEAGARLSIGCRSEEELSPYCNRMMGRFRRASAEWP